MTTLATSKLELMPAHSRVWIFQSSVPLTGELLNAVDTQLSNFLNDWAAHGSPLMTGYEILFDRFIVIAVDEEVASASGCSIDKMMREVQSVDEQHKLDLLNRLKVAYRSGEDVVECDVNEFKQKLDSSEIDANTMVFNNLVPDLKSFRDGWETQVSNSWHANLLP